MTQFKIWSRLLLVVVVFVFVLKYTEKAEAGSPQIYCTSGYGQCMSCLLYTSKRRNAVLSLSSAFSCTIHGEIHNLIEVLHLRAQIERAYSSFQLMTL